jgi:glycosyltransferase involved in cell wall biosynthesis
MATRESARHDLDIPEQDFRIAWLGRLSHEKGPDIMIDALAQTKDLSITASLIGDGPSHNSLLDQIRALRLADRVVVHGAVPDAGQLLPAFDLFVLSSRTEGTPITVLEAMAAEVPIIATAVGGVPDMLSNAEARLVAPENPSALARVIDEVAQDPAAAQARASNARQRLDRDFNVDTWLARYESIYRSIQ